MIFNFHMTFCCKLQFLNIMMNIFVFGMCNVYTLIQFENCVTNAESKMRHSSIVLLILIWPTKELDLCRGCYSDYGPDVTGYHYPIFGPNIQLQSSLFV